ncbi:hypothetical protein OAD21_02260 [Amylibacter sp.]|nr:hypothetical protein [Amylibacter sp.]
MIKIIKSLKDMFWTIFGLIGLMMLIGGSNFYMSYRLDLLQYSGFSFLHMMAVYTSAVLQLSISSSAPRVIAKSKRDGLAIVDKLVGASFYALCAFLLIAILAQEILINYYGVTYWEYVFYMSFTVLSAVIMNINGILYGISQIKNGSLQLIIASAIYLTILSQGIVNGRLDYEFISKGVIALLIALVIFNKIIYKFKYCGISEIYGFIKSKDSVTYLLPNLIAGIMNGMALALIYSAYAKSVSDVFLLGYAGYILFLRSVILFLNTALNKLYFLKFSNEYFQKDSGSIGDGVMALLMKNILSIVLSGCMIIVAYHLFYEEYFSKYNGVQGAVYALFGLWLVFEVVYLTLYQKIQVYGLMWESLTAISLPTVVYALILNRLEVLQGLESLLLVYISIMAYSILITMYISNKKEKKLEL